MELASSRESEPASVFHVPDFRHLLVTTGCSSLAGRGLVMVVGYQVFEVTKNPLSLGILGLVEAIPSLSLALYGGHVADRYDRRWILRTTTAVLAICCTLLMLTSASSPALVALYGIMFVVGIARGFADPAAGALEAQVVPPSLIVKSATWYASTWLTCSVLGPVIAGQTLSYFGAAATYTMFAALYAAGWIAALRMSPRPSEPFAARESVYESIRAGVAYVAGDQVLVGSMALDLFAVLFGGAIALLPIFATEILHVGERGLGYLSAAPYAGALFTMLIATRHPPVRHAGRNLLASVALFGVCMIVFALSRNYYLSLVALFLSGVFDGVSVVIRKSIIRLLSPNHLRGRIAAVSMLFIGSSNELGALESGLAAAWLGTVPSVLAGATVTLLVVACTTAIAPRLRRLRLDRVATIVE